MNGGGGGGGGWNGGMEGMCDRPKEGGFSSFWIPEFASYNVCGLSFTMLYKGSCSCWCQTPVHHW